ncbi:MAG: hypothetical protein ACRD0A_00555 [Acidimicrobiales bacterium]
MGEVADIVNSGISVIKLVANSAGVDVKETGYANGLPAGTKPDDLIGGDYKRVTKQWKQDTPWYEFYNVDFDFTVGMNWKWGLQIDGAHQMVDMVTVTLDVDYLPADQTVEVEAHFPGRGSREGTEDDVIATLPFTIAVQMNYFLGQLVGWRKTLNCEVRGDGAWQMA